ncbi:hypothetical protein Gasu2_43650 [Galdieria sulphuraria]|nr:hypothetical protein Gasu2_43650 [Galdieria sulphuraria]
MWLLLSDVVQESSLSELSVSKERWQHLEQNAPNCSLGPLTERKVRRLVEEAKLGASRKLFSGFSVVIRWKRTFFERRAEESRKQQQFLENASAQLVADWDFSDSVEADLTSFDTFEIEEMVRWFEVLEELEGPGAMQFFQEVLLSDSVEKRVTLARCLGRCQTRSNILLCTLQQLAMKDSNSLVRNVARNSIRELIRHNVIPSPPLHLPENLSVFSMLNEEQSLRELSISYEKIPSGVFHVSGKSRITESNSDANLDSFLENSFTPFDRMDVLDIVTFCGLSSVIMGLQFYCLSHSVDLPFRFVALGWVFGVGGLIVYPRSGRLWQYLRRTTLLRSLFSELAMFS